MKRLPNSELELMMIIWKANKPVTRGEIEQELDEERKIGATTILSFLSRLVEKGFVKVTKSGKNNVYTPLIQEEDYLRRESSSILKLLYRNSITNFVSAFVSDNNLSKQDIEELQKIIDEQKNL